MHLPDLLQSPFTRSGLSGIAGFLAYGGWAFFINQHNHGFISGLKAGFTQGSYSLTMTLTLTLMMEALFRALPTGHSRFWLTAVFICLILYSTSWSIHYLSGTPEILTTILPSLTISTVYTFSYLYSLTVFTRITAQI